MKSLIGNGSVAILDIGSSKVVCFIARIDASGNVQVEGVGHQVSQGIRAGLIVDIKLAEKSILAAVHTAEKMAGETIEKVIVNQSGASLDSQRLNVETAISGQEVTDRDIHQIINQGCKHFGKDEREILHCIPTHYTIDDTTGIEEPRGMYGEKLSTDLHIITTSSTAIRNLSNCLARCHLNIDDCVASPYASAIACLQEDEKELGATVLDIGGGTTSIAVYANGHLVYTHSIPVAGGHITRDIARGLSTSIAYAERIKTLYGSAISMRSDEDEVIDIPVADMESGEEEGSDPMEQGYVSKATLTSIIRPRVEEIFELVKRELEKSGIDEITGPRIVLTGGTSQLQGIKELAGHTFNKHVRIGRPTDIEGLADAMRGPAFATPIGMLNYAATTRSSMLEGAEEKEVISSNKGTLGRVLIWFQKNF